MNKIKQWYNKIPDTFKNKYLIVIVLFSVWIVFLDEHNLIILNKRSNILQEKQDEKQLLIEEIKTDSNTLHSLNNDPEAIEKFARENFLMKKENEDIFIIREKSDEQNNASIIENQQKNNYYRWIIYFLPVLLIITVTISIISRQKKNE
ncbi:MAG: hypothetical protein HN427_07300 [Flavobacteriales bacterium]|jgi:cell division protein FtsB|nr:hypothetical protein [Flavobacteriales bacterium]MBT6013831.1 hypothetical protein [Flavobacteriales bacterium]